MSAPYPATTATLNQAWDAYHRGDHAQARRLCLQLIDANPAAAEPHHLLGLSEAAAGQPAIAIRALKQAARLSPSAGYLAQLARVLVQTKNETEALQAAAQAQAAAPGDALTLDTIGCVYSHAGRHDQALPLFEAAVALQPRHPQHLYNLASTLGFLGRFDEAERYYERIVEAQPRFVKAHAALSGLRRQTPGRNHVARLQALVAAAGPAEYLHLGYALAKEYEDLGRHDDAFAQLQRINRRRRRELGYDIGFDRANVERLIERFSDPDYFAGPGCDDPAPIFVLGLPRSGTTLVDRILASHPRVESAGELQTMPVALKRLAATRSRFVLDPETIDAAAAVAPQRLGRRYLDDSATRRRGAARFVDKLPLNFLHLGYIARALPGARIVCLRRHPMDSVWSNFKHLFATNFSYYNYSYDLLDAAEYYVLFDRLMAFWRQRFPGRVLEVRYEELVEDQAGQTRRLLRHCGLDWDDACLAFHRNAGAVATPSASQVRQPIYRSALARWRAYEAHLQPVKEYFQRNGIEV